MTLDSMAFLTLWWMAAGNDAVAIARIKAGYLFDRWSMHLRSPFGCRVESRQGRAFRAPISAVGWCAIDCNGETITNTQPVQGEGWLKSNDRLILRYDDYYELFYDVFF